MRRGPAFWLPFLIFVALAVSITLVLRQTAIFEGDAGPKDASTQVITHVRYQDGQPASDGDARLLWLVCETVPGERDSIAIHGGTVRATLTPALGVDVQRRLVGCLEDFTLGGMLGDVESARLVPLSGTTSLPAASGQGEVRK